MLTDCHWADSQDNDKSIDFKEIEIDILVHVESPLSERFDLGQGFYLLKPDTPAQPEKIFNHQISDSAIDANANAYVLAEVTKDGTSVMAKKKMYQMERDLAFLLARAQLKFNDPGITVGNIVRLAILITPTAHIKEVSEFLINSKSRLPLLYSLLQQNRVYLGKVKPKGDSTYVSAMMRGWNSVSDIVTSLSNSSQQKVIRIGHGGQLVEINVSDCVTWADFIDKVGMSSGTLFLSESVARAYRMDNGVPAFVETVDALIANETYYVATAGESIPVVASPQVAFKTMHEFYEALRGVVSEEEDIALIEAVFQEQRIGAAVLPRLTDEKLKEAGVKQVGLREAILAVQGKQ